MSQNSRSQAVQFRVIDDLNKCCVCVSMGMWVIGTDRNLKIGFILLLKIREDISLLSVFVRTFTLENVRTFTFRN